MDLNKPVTHWLDVCGTRYLCGRLRKGAPYKSSFIAKLSSEITCPQCRARFEKWKAENLND